MADPLSLAAGVIAIIQLTGTCLKLSRKWIGPSEYSSTDLATVTTNLYAFTGAMTAFRTHLEIHEDDEARLSSLEHLSPVLQRSTEALDVVRSFFGEGRLHWQAFDRPEVRPQIEKFTEGL